MILTGKNKAFKAVWDCRSQTYHIFKDGNFVINVFSYTAVKNYLK